MDGGMILKCILSKLGEGCLQDFSVSEDEPVRGEEAVLDTVVYLRIS
jgi:hypothetical protein